jgi:hypothetical protein
MVPLVFDGTISFFIHFWGKKYFFSKTVKLHKEIEKMDNDSTELFYSWRIGLWDIYVFWTFCMSQLLARPEAELSPVSVALHD